MIELLDYKSKKKSNKLQVAIVGIGLRLPGKSNSGLELWNNLKNGINCVTKTTDRWSDNYYESDMHASNYAGLIDDSEWKNFDPSFFGITVENAKQMDPQHKLLLKLTVEACEDGNIPILKLKGSETSVFIGQSNNDYIGANQNDKSENKNIFNSTACSASARISHAFDLRSVSLNIDTACSSSLNALHLAYNSIKSSESQTSIVGGVNYILEPKITEYFTKLSMLSKTGSCKTFDKDADGYVRSEGCAVIILKRLDLAIRDNNKIYCLINGSSSNVDGMLNKLNFLAPSKLAQSNNIINAFKSTKNLLNVNDLDYFESHGTGTPIGDPIETEAISIALKELNRTNDTKKPLLIGSIKPNIGHCEALSGIASIIKCCLMFKNREFIKNINFNNPNPNINFKEWNLKVITESIPFPNKRVSMGINCFGITGSNCCVLLNEFIREEKEEEENESLYNISSNNNIYLIPFSSSSKNSLNMYQESILNIYSNIKKSIEFESFIKYQIFCKSIEFSQRSVAIASNYDELKQALTTKLNFIPTQSEKYLNSDYIISTKSNSLSNLNSQVKNPPLVFVFTGQGPQYRSMQSNLYSNNKVFREMVDKLDLMLSKYYGYSIMNKLRSIKDDEMLLLNEPILAQPSLFIIQVSLYELYKYYSIEPTIITGHSFGEISAACCSGMLSLEDSCRVVYFRSKLQNQLNGTGKMLVVGLSESEFIEKFSKRYPLIEISCFNSSTSIVITGSESDIENVSAQLSENQIFNYMMGSTSSFHSSKQKSIKSQIFELLNDLKPKLPNITHFSTVTSNQFNNDNGLFTSKYLYLNVRKPVQFHKTIQNIIKHIEDNNLGTSPIFLEITPHTTLSTFISQIVQQNNSIYFKKDSVSILSPLNKKNSNDIVLINKTISQLFCLGYNVNFACQFNQIDLKDLSNIRSSFKIPDILPKYPWDEKEYWQVDKEFQQQLLNGPSIDHFGLAQDLPFISRSTLINIDKKCFNYLKGHKVRDRIYIPGCLYIDILIGIFDGQDLTISYLEFKNPLILESVSEYKHLQTNLIQTSRNEYKVTFHYKDIKTNKWILTSTGKVTLLSHGSSSSIKYNIQELKDKCNLVKLSKQEVYSNIRNTTGLNYTGSFQRIKESFCGDNCFFSIIELFVDNNNNCSSKKSFLDPSVLDSCIHSSLSFFQDKAQLLFTRIEDFKVYTSNIPKNLKCSNLYCYSEFKYRIGQSLYSTIKVFLQDGTLLIESPELVTTSIAPIVDPLKIDLETESFARFSQQPINSPIDNSKNTLNSIFLKSGFKIEQDYQIKLEKSEVGISKLFYDAINSRNSDITYQVVQDNSIDQLYKEYFKIENTLINKRKFYRVFEIIKDNIQVIKDQNFINPLDNSNLFEDFKLYLFETSRFISKQLFPSTSEESEEVHIKIQNGLVENIYNIPYLKKLYKVISCVIKESIEPLVKENLHFRILEIGGGFGSLSNHVVESINQLIEKYPNYQIDIEYTFTDISRAFIEIAKTKLLINQNTITFKLLDLNRPFSQQDIRNSYFDFIISSNSLHVANDLKFSLNEIYKSLSPNGQLIFIEPVFKNKHCDCFVGLFQNWWSWSDTELRNDHCTLTNEQWNKLLYSIGFTNYQSLDYKSNICFVARVIKQSYILEKNSVKLLSSPSQDQDNSPTLIIYGSSVIFNSLFNEDQQFLLNNFKNIKNIKDIQEFELNQHLLTDNTVILFISSLEILELNQIKQVSLDYINICQVLYKNLLSSKLVILSLNAEKDSSNYLVGSLYGAMKYFGEFPKLGLYSFDFDNQSLNNKVIWFILNYVNSSSFYQRQIIIRNNNIYYERTSPYRNLKLKFKSSSFEENILNYNSTLDANLNYKLISRDSIINDDHVEVQVKSFGLNFKDNLAYRSLLPLELINSKGNPDKPEIGMEYSGIISRVGKNVTKYSVGDSVIGLSNCASSYYITSHQDLLLKKPDNLTFTQGASIAAVFLTSYYSIFKVGNYKKEFNESILIHSASGGVGLSALYLLKYFNVKAPIFVTVGSEEKKQFLLDNYGSIITGIYSSRDSEFVKKIKERLIEIGSNKVGVDLILNSLSNEFLDANFKCLNQGGRLLDISVTHLNPYEYTDFNKFKWFISYHSIELLYVPTEQLKLAINELSPIFETISFSNYPIIQYSSSDIKKAIDSMSTRSHIGKIVINIDENLIKNIYSSNKQYYDNHFRILKSDYTINSQILGKNILVTGQMGLILEILKWIVKSKESKNIIVVSRSSLKWEMEKLIKDNSNKHSIHFQSVDVSNFQLLEESINSIMKINQIETINSIFHFAFNTCSTHPEDISMNDLNITMDAKLFGAINLHNLSLKYKWEIKNFIMASSMASIISSPLQCAYSCANNAINLFSNYRRSLGLPSLSLNMGKFDFTGYVSRNDKVNQILDDFGLISVTVNSLLGFLDLLLQNENVDSNQILNRFDPKLFEALKTHSFCYRMDYITNTMSSFLDYNKNSVDENETIQDLILALIANRFGIEKSKIDTSNTLVEMSADSLILFQIKSWIDTNIRQNLISTIQFQALSIDNIIKIISKEKVNLQLLKSKIKYQDQNDNTVTVETTTSTTVNQDFNENKEIKEIKSEEYWLNECKLDESIKIEFEKSKYDPQQDLNILRRDNSELIIFCTGITGFLGAYVVSDLLLNSKCKIIYCLVRNKKSIKEAFDSIINNLTHYGLYKKLRQSLVSFNRIVPVIGDLGFDNLGLNQIEFDSLSSEINLILNLATPVNLVQDYEKLKKINMNSIIKLSCHKVIKRLVHISSTGVYNNFNTGEKINDDTLPLINQDINYLSGYCQGKIVQDHMVNQASIIGIPSLLIRLPFLSWDPDTDICSSNGLDFLLMKSIYSTKCYFETNIMALFSPVTWASKNIVNLIFNQESWINSSRNQLNAFNLISDHYEINSILESVGTKYSFEKVSVDEFSKRINSSNNEYCKMLSQVQFNLSSTNPFKVIENLANHLQLSQKTKSILISMNSLDGNQVSKKSVKKCFINNLKF